MPFPPVDVSPGPKVLAAALKLAGFSDTALLPAVTDKCGMAWAKPSQLQVMLAVCGGESSGHAWAWHENTDGSTDWGILQINDTSHEEYFTEITNPLQLNWANYYDNAQMAWEIFTAAKSKFTPWNAYNGGGYLAERYGGRSWMDWGQHGVTAMQAGVQSLVTVYKMTETAALQETASMNWDILKYWS